MRDRSNYGADPGRLLARLPGERVERARRPQTRVQTASGVMSVMQCSFGHDGDGQLQDRVVDGDAVIAAMSAGGARPLAYICSAVNEVRPLICMTDVRKVVPLNVVAPWALALPAIQLRPRL